jgi:hypothetical protein
MVHTALGNGYQDYPNSNRTVTELLLAVAAIFLTHAAAHFVFLHSTSFYGKLKPKEAVAKSLEQKMPPQHSFTQSFVCMTWSAIFFMFYAFGIYEVMWTPELRWKGRSETIEWGLLLHCAYSVYEESIYIYFGKPLEMHIHHIVVLYNYSITLMCGQMYFWAAWDGTVEVTNVPLSLMCMFQDMGYKVHPIIGVSLFLSFLVFRVIGMAAWLYFFFIDVKHCDWDAVPGILIWAVVPSTAFLWILSNVWFYKITKGMLKVLGLIAPTDKGKKKA